MHPGLRDRIEALGAFTGIAIGAVAGVEMVIGGGFDVLMPGDELRQVAPSAYVQVADGFWDSRAQVIPLSSTEPYFMGDDYYEFAASADTALSGGYEDTAAPDGDYPPAPDMDALNAEIEALYAETANFARDVQRDDAYDSSWGSNEGGRYKDELNVADNMGDAGYAAGGYADAYAAFQSEERASEQRIAPAPRDLQAVEPIASESASPS